MNSDKNGALVLNLHDIGCRNRCVFCANLSGRLNKKETDKIAEEELKKLDLLKKHRNIGTIIISGNDPIEYHGFVDFLKK